MATPWLAAHTLAERIRVCVCEQLDLMQAQLADEDPPITVDGCPDRSCVTVPGVAWENCECGGEMIVSVDEIVATDDFPNADSEPSGCHPSSLAASLVIRVLRCACVSSDTTAPSCVCRAQEALQVTADRAAVLQGLMCCLGEPDDTNDLPLWLFMGSVPVGPAGGCVGSETRVMVDLGVCPCEEVV